MGRNRVWDSLIRILGVFLHTQAQDPGYIDIWAKALVAMLIETIDIEYLDYVDRLFFHELTGLI